MVKWAPTPYRVITMEPIALLSVDELLDHAYEIFLELAADNLSEAQIALYNAEFEERGALRITSYNVCYTKLLRRRRSPP